MLTLLIRFATIIRSIIRAVFLGRLEHIAIQLASHIEPGQDYMSLKSLREHLTFRDYTLFSLLQKID